MYQISSMAVQAMPVYQSYIETMNEDIRRAFKVRNPFQFKHIQVPTGGGGGAVGLLPIAGGGRSPAVRAPSRCGDGPGGSA